MKYPCIHTRIQHGSRELNTIFDIHLIGVRPVGYRSYPNLEWYVNRIVPAIFISICAVAAQYRLQKENNNLQRATSELARKQLEILVRDEKGRDKARLALDLRKESRGQFRFVISNISDVDALTVNLELLLDDPEKSPLVASDVAQKLPAPKLSPGSSITLIAALHLGSPLAYRARLTWINPDGAESADVTFASL